MKIQEMFDKVALHLMTQKKRAINNEGLCQYLTEDGCQCAAGCLIPPDQYYPKMEGIAAYELSFFVNLGEASDGCAKFLDVLGDLQELHDHTPVCDWKPELQKLVLKHQLSLPECLSFA
jgi:hypothetical protein